MLEPKSQGKTVREIGEKFGLTYEQVREFSKDTIENSTNLQQE